MAATTDSTVAADPETASPESDQQRHRGLGVNRVTLVGRLAADPELRFLPSGTAVARLRVATNETSEVQFHTVSAVGRTAETVGEYLHKGSLAYIEGRLHHSEYEKDGVRRKATEVRAREVQFLDRPAPTIDQRTP